MVELRRNAKTGIVESFKNGKKIGSIITMGDSDGKVNRSNKSQNRSNRSKK